MNHDELTRLKKLIIHVAAYYNRDLKPEVVTMMAEDLSDLGLSAVEEAYSKYRREDKKMLFPMPAIIRSLVCPQIDDDSVARAAVARIVEAFTKFGYPNPDEAKEFIGELGWSVVKRSGGWVSLCHASSDRTFNFETFAAQARDLAKSHIQLSRSGKLDTPIGLPEGDSKTMALISNLAEQKSLNKPVDK